MTASLLLVAWLLQQAPTFVIGGTVVHAATGQPLSKVRVFVAPSEDRSKLVSVVTGPNGRFRFDGLKQGKYSLSAERLGFVRQGYKEHFLQSGYSTAVVTGEHEATESLEFRMIPGAVLTGYVMDSRGEPVAGLSVHALRIAGTGSFRRIQRWWQNTTDDRGYYRMYALAAGQYVLVISGRPWQSQPLPEIEPAAYPLTYFPGVRNPDDARMISLESGQEFRADVIVAAVRAVRVHGRLIKSNPDYRLALTLTAPSFVGGEYLVGGTPRLLQDTFEIEEVPPGRYFLNLSKGGTRIGRRAIEVSPSDTSFSIGETTFAKVLARVEVLGSPKDAERRPVLTLRQVGGPVVYTRAVDADGQAVLPSVPPGRYELSVRRGRQLALISIVARGAAEAGGIVDIPETGVVELAVVVDASADDIGGRVFRAQEPQSGILVMLVPRDRLGNFSAYRFDQSDSDGTFTWHGVARGDYLMFALEKGEPLDYSNSEAVRALLPLAQPVTITGEGKPAVRLDMLVRQFVTQ